VAILRIWYFDANLLIGQELSMKSLRGSDCMSMRWVSCVMAILWCDLIAMRVIETAHTSRYYQITSSILSGQQDWERHRLTFERRYKWSIHLPFSLAHYTLDFDAFIVTWQNLQDGSGTTPEDYLRQGVEALRELVDTGADGAAGLWAEERRNVGGFLL
jgi:hypothetical protein